MRVCFLSLAGVQSISRESVGSLEGMDADATPSPAVMILRFEMIASLWIYSYTAHPQMISSTRVNTTLLLLRRRPLGSIFSLPRADGTDRSEPSVSTASHHTPGHSSFPQQDEAKLGRITQQILGYLFQLEARSSNGMCVYI